MQGKQEKLVKETHAIRSVWRVGGVAGKGGGWEEREPIREAPCDSAVRGKHILSNMISKVAF